MNTLFQLESEKDSCILYNFINLNHLQGKQLAKRGGLRGLLTPSEIRAAGQQNRATDAKVHLKCT